MDGFTERFAVMGTTAEVNIVGGAPSLLTVARTRLQGLEQRWSRFLPTSEVSVLNAARGETRRVSGETFTLFARASEGHELTDGRFDPWRLAAIEAIGYRRPFDRLGVPVMSPVPTVKGWTRPVELDAEHRTVRLLDGARFDPGGIGKGLAADLVAEELVALGARGVCVNVGGDLRVLGPGPDGEAWSIALRDRPEDEPVGRIAVADGGIATTSRSRRTWTTTDGTRHHHVLDPATGTSSTSDSIWASAIASRAWQAEVLSKVAFLDGAAGIARAELVGATAMVVTGDGVTRGHTWARFEGAEVVA